MSCLSLNTPTAPVLSFPAKHTLADTHTPTRTHRLAFIHSINLSCPVEKLQLSKGLCDVQKWGNLHAKRVVSGDIASDLSSGWHYHHQRSDIRDNFFLSRWRDKLHTFTMTCKEAQLLHGYAALWATVDFFFFFSGSIKEWVDYKLCWEVFPFFTTNLFVSYTINLLHSPLSLALLCSRLSTAWSLEGMEMEAY